MPEKLDRIDRSILQTLQANSKITNLDLSKKIGLSPAPTLERVKKLEHSGIIESYHAQVNPQEIGLNVQTFVLVSLAWQKENALNQFLEKIKAIDEIVECYIITGEADFLIKIICKDIPTYEQLLFKTLSQIEEIERLKTLMTLSTVKNAKVLPLDYSEKTTGKKKKNSLLWQVKGVDIPRPSYVFGTMHVKDKRVLEGTPLVFEKIHACEAFAVEFHLEAIPTHFNTAIFDAAAQKPIAAHLSKKKFQKLQKILFKAFQVDIAMPPLNTQPPMFITNIIAEQILSKDLPVALDAHLWDYAKAQKKRLLGIETIEEQFAILNKIPLDYQVKGLLAIGKNVKKYRQQLLKMTQIYQEGNIQKLFKSTKKGVGNFRRLMLYDRNEIMATRMAKIMKEQTLFAAIGAGHLGGQKGILRLLKKKGFKVNPVKKKSTLPSSNFPTQIP